MEDYNFIVSYDAILKRHSPSNFSNLDNQSYSIPFPSQIVDILLYFHDFLSFVYAKSTAHMNKSQIAVRYCRLI